jgi:hypothetical protein
MTISRALDAFMEDRQQENHLQGTDEARQESNIRAIQSQCF